MKLSKDHFRKPKTIAFSNIIDDLVDCVNVAMSNAEINDEHFCEVRGNEMRDNETDDVLCKVVVVDVVTGLIHLECYDGVATIPLNIFN